MNPGSIDAKKQNIVGIARTIYDHPLISRKELGRQFGLSASTVTLAVHSLMERHLIAECGTEEAAAGRKARLLQINARAGCILTVHPDENLSIQFRLCDLCGQRLLEHTVPAPVPCPDQSSFPAYLSQRASDFLTRASELPPLLAAAVIIPGIMNGDGTADLPVFGWEALDLSFLAQTLQVPVFCDTILHMLGGYEVHQQPPAARQIYLSLEPGVGMSCFEQGQMRSSSNHLYGEIGHISMHEDGPVCYCGNRGCLEYYCGISGILSRMAQAVPQCPILSRCPLTLDGLAQAARLGSSAAQNLLDQTAVELGRALITIRNILDPDQIIVSGSLWQIPEVRRTALTLLRSRTFSSRRPLPLFLDATLSPNQYEIGVCHYVFSRLIATLF